MCASLLTLRAVVLTASAAADSNQLDILSPGESCSVIMFHVLPGNSLHIAKQTSGLKPTAGYDSHSSSNHQEWYLFDESQCLPAYVLTVKAVEGPAHVRRRHVSRLLMRLGRSRVANSKPCPMYIPRALVLTPPLPHHQETQQRNARGKKYMYNENSKRSQTRRSMDKRKAAHTTVCTVSAPILSRR
jgi:hypothetical protein